MAGTGAEWPTSRRGYLARAGRSAGDHPIAAGALGAEERLVGTVEEGLDRLVGAARAGDADRHTDARDADRGEVEVPNRLADALADLDRHVGPRVPQQDGELLAADSRRHVLLAD